MTAHGVVMLACDYPACLCGGVLISTHTPWPNKIEARKEAADEGWSTEFYELALEVLDFCPVATAEIAKRSGNA